MNKKIYFILFIIFTIVFLFILYLVLAYFFPEQTKIPLINDFYWPSQKKEMLSLLPEKYQALGRNCERRWDFGCCYKSLQTIVDNNLTALEQPGIWRGCPEGYKLASSYCSDSLHWCEPIKN